MFYSSAPVEPHDSLASKPALIFSWWCTIYAAFIIGARLVGRKMRTKTFFPEDYVEASALIPLFIHQGFVHMVLKDGTNNTDLTGLTSAQVDQREFGSKMVLAARVFFAVYIWTSKATMVQFLHRTLFNSRGNSIFTIVNGLRLMLAVSLVVVIATVFVGCEPVSHLWQVTPDPGAACRQGFDGLVAFAVADVLTNMVLACVPLPVIWGLRTSLGRRVFLTILFSLSWFLIVVSIARVPFVIAAHGRQVTRTVWASGMILATTFVSNVIVVVSFVRDRGAKRPKQHAGVHNGYAGGTISTRGVTNGGTKLGGRSVVARELRDEGDLAAADGDAMDGKAELRAFAATEIQITTDFTIATEPYA